MHRTIRQGTELAHQARGLDPTLPARGRRGRQSPVLAAPPNLPPLTGLRLHTPGDGSWVCTGPPTAVAALATCTSWGQPGQCKNGTNAAKELSASREQSTARCWGNRTEDTSYPTESAKFKFL